MKSSHLNTILLLTSALMFTGIILCCLLDVDKASTPAVSGWSTFNNKAYGFTFQYPSNWSVEIETMDIIKIAPPASSHVPTGIQGDGDWSTYGIRISPLETYPTLPTALTLEDVHNGFSRIGSYKFQTITLITGPSEVVKVLYDIDGNEGSLVLFKEVNGRLLQIEMGRNFSTPLVSEVVIFTAVAMTLQAI